MNKQHQPDANATQLRQLRNVGPAALADLNLLGIVTIKQLEAENADKLYVRLCQITGKRHDPCVHDVFRAIIRQAKTGEVIDWRAFSPERKQRQQAGTFVVG
jgi:nucleotidyltransferase/DNA polymerase involved in DNA repair